MATREELLNPQSTYYQKENVYALRPGDTPEQYWARLTPASTPTLTPTPTPAPTPTPIPTANIRQPRNTYLDDVENLKKQVQGGIDTAGQSLERSRQELQNLLNARLQGIEAVSAQNIANIQRQGERAQGQVRGINVRAGLIGTPFAETRAEGQKQLTEQQLSTERERAAAQKAAAQSEVQVALGDIENRYNQRLDTLRSQSADLLAKGVAITQQERKKVEENLASIAKSGQYSFDQFKASPLRDEVTLQMTGKTDVNDLNDLDRFYTDSVFFNNKPGAKEIFSGFKGDNFVRITEDPVTGKTNTMTYSAKDLGIPKNVSPKTITVGDTMYWYDESDPVNTDGTPKLQKLGSTESDLERRLKESQIAENLAQAKKIVNEAGAGTTPQEKVKAKEQINLMKGSLDRALALAGASGRSGIRKAAESWLYGSTNYTNLVAETNTLRTNVLTLATDPAIKKFFGPQMSNADVQLMTSAGTTLNPELQSSDNMKKELGRLKDLLNRMEVAVSEGQAGGSSADTASASGYPEGTTAVGDDGLNYIVRNGKWVKQ